MNLLEKIDNELRMLTESLSPEKLSELMTFAKIVDPNLEGSSLKDAWGLKDTKWNELVKNVSESKNNNIKYYVVKLENAVDKKTKNKISDNYLYLNWTGDLVKDKELEDVYLTNMNNATVLQTNFLEKDERDKLVKALSEDETSKNIAYSDLNCVEKNETANEHLTLFDVINYYYEFATNGGDINKDYNDYWKRAVLVNVSDEKNIISNKIMTLLIKARKQNSALRTCLQTDQVASETIYALLDERSRYEMSVDQIINYNNYFLLDLLVRGCYKSNFKSASDIIQSFAVFDKIRNDFEYGQLKLKYNLEDILQGNTKKDKADTLARNVLTYTDNIDNNIFLEITSSDDPSNIVTDYIRNKDIIAKVNVSDNLRVCEMTQIKAILDEIVDQVNTEGNKYFLLIGKNKYKLFENEGKLISKENSILFNNKSVVIFAFGLSSSLDEKDNQFTQLTDLNNAVQFNFSAEKPYNVADYFEIKNGLLVTKDIFILKSTEGTNTLFSYDLENKKLTILTPPEVPTEKDLQNAEDKENDDNLAKEAKLDNETRAKLQEAIINYLKLHKTKLLPKDNLIEKFIRTPQSSNYEKLKEIVLQQLFERPDMYYYNSDTNEIGNIENTYLSMLVDILNKNLDRAKEKMNNMYAKHNISPYIDIQYRQFPNINKETAQDIAQKLDTLKNILNQDTTNSTNSIDSNTKKQLRNHKGDLADTIAWLNNRLGPKKSAVVKNTAEPTDNNE